MTIEKILAEYKNSANKEEYISKHIKRKYVPFSEKLAMCRSVVEQTMEKEIDGKSYSFCNDCNDNAYKDETWRYMYCSQNCRGIFNVLSAKAFGHIGNEEAANKLQALDLSKKMQFREDYREQINNILSSVKKEEPVLSDERSNQSKKKQKKIMNREDKETSLSY